MTDAVIVSTARTPLCKSWKGALNMTHGATMGGHVVKATLERAKLDPAEVEDVIMDCDPCWDAGHGLGHDGQPLLLIGAAGRGAGVPAYPDR
jgi:acetyl-CoA acetyltransferase